MKSHRKSRSTENRNAHKEMIARGGSRTSMLRMLPDTFNLNDRRFRRILRRYDVDASSLDLMTVTPKGSLTPLVYWANERPTDPSGTTIS